MTVGTVDDVLNETLGLIVAFLTAIGVFVSAIVGLLMLKYLAGIITGLIQKAKRI